MGNLFCCSSGFNCLMERVGIIHWGLFRQSCTITMLLLQLHPAPSKPDLKLYNIYLQYLHLHSRCLLHNCKNYLQFRRLALKSPPLGPKWGRWAKKLRCASNPPVCSLLVWEDRMCTRVFSPTYHTWALVGGTSRPAGETVV